MRPRYLQVLSLVLWPTSSFGQTESSAPYHIYGGITYFSNSFNGIPNLRSHLLGWDSAVSFPAWRGLRFKIDVSGTTGENHGAQQRALFILGGGEYEQSVWRERLFVHALFGDAGLNRYWGPQRLPGGTASFAVLLGGGVDTPISRHLSLRAEADMQHTNLALVNIQNLDPYRVPGLPNFMGRFSAGLVWTPRTGNPASALVHPTGAE